MSIEIGFQISRTPAECYVSKECLKAHKTLAFVENLLPNSRYLRDLHYGIYEGFKCQEEMAIGSQQSAIRSRRLG